MFFIALHNQYLDEWAVDDKMFVTTKATKYVNSSLKKHNIIVVTGSSGNGKSSIIHHVALRLHLKHGYEVIPFVTGPQDIINFRDPRTRQVFVVDDICGKEAINVSSVEQWRAQSEKIEKIFKGLRKGQKNLSDQSEFTQTSSAKLLVSCRLHVYRDLQFQMLKPFTKNECNLLSSELCLSCLEKMKMTKRYLPDQSCYLLNHGSFDFFPLLCKLAMGKTYSEITNLFTSPVDTIKDDLSCFMRCQNKYQFCALVLCILLENGFNPDWLKLNFAPVDERDKVEKIAIECDININTERQREHLKYCFKTLELTYLKKRGKVYIMVHDKIHEIAALLYGRHLPECFIKYAPSSFVRDHFRFDSIEKKENEKVITLSEYLREEYLKRMIQDIKAGYIISTFGNENLVIDSFRAEFIKLFQHDPAVKLALKNFFRHESSFYNTTPLMEAARQGFADIVKVFIDFKCNVNNRSFLGGSPLFIACERGHETIVKLLLDNSADLSIFDNNGRSVLHISCLKGHIGVVKLLLEKSFKYFTKKTLNYSPFLSAKELKHKVDNLSLRNGLSLSLADEDGRTPFYLACKEGHTNIVKQLLEKNADVSKCNNRGQSPLIAACKAGYFDIVALLLKMNVNVNKKCKDGRASLHFACKGRYLSVVELLIQHKANVSQLGWANQSPLYVACEGGHTDVVKMLLNSNADVAQCGQYGKTPKGKDIHVQ